MNISTNNVNFMGTKEVVYALRRAAQESCNYEIARAMSEGPRTTAYQSSARTVCDAKVATYMDMAVYDDSFVKTIKELDSENKGALKSLLEPKQWQYNGINPMEVFSKYMFSTLKKQNKNVEPEILDNFIKSILA